MNILTLLIIIYSSRLEIQVLEGSVTQQLVTSEYSTATQSPLHGCCYCAIFKNFIISVKYIVHYLDIYIVCLKKISLDLVFELFNYLDVYCLIYMYLKIFLLSFCYNLQFCLFCQRAHFRDFNCFLLVKFYFLSQDIVILCVFYGSLKETHILLFGGRVFHNIIQSLLIDAVLSLCVSLLIFCLVVLSIMENGMLKSQTIIVNLFISLFQFYQIFIYFAPLLFGAFTFRIYISLLV